MQWQSVCERAGVSQLAVFFCPTQSARLSRRVPLSSLSVIDGFGSAGASLNEWARVLRVWTGGGQHAIPALGPVPPSPKTAARKTVARCIVALGP